MKKFLSIFLLALFLPLSAHAATFTHPDFGFTFEYPSEPPNSWSNITEEFKPVDLYKDPYYLLLSKTIRTNPDIPDSNNPFSNIRFFAFYAPNFEESIAQYSAEKQQDNFFATMKNNINNRYDNVTFISSEVLTINNISYLLLKFQTPTTGECWHVMFLKDKVLHYIWFYQRNTPNLYTFQQDWLQILDSLTKSL